MVRRRRVFPIGESGHIEVPLIHRGAQDPRARYFEFVLELPGKEAGPGGRTDRAQAARIALSLLNGEPSRPAPLDPAPAGIQKKGHGIPLEEMSGAGLIVIADGDARNPQAVAALLCAL